MRCRYSDANESGSEVVDRDETSGSDREIWDGYVNETNRIYEELLRMNQQLKADLTKKKKTRPVDVLMMDMYDLDEFFRGLDEALVLSQSGVSNRGDNNTDILRMPLSISAHNKEKLQICNFGLKSKMIKLLKPSLTAYRNLTLSL